VFIFAINTVFRTSDHARHPVMSALAGKGEHVWTYVNLTPENVWFCASFIVRKSDRCAWPETMLLSSVEQVVEVCRDFKELIEASRLMLVSPSQLNKTDDWQMEPLREIWCGRDPDHGDKVFVYTLVSGRQYIDSIRAVEYAELQDLERVVSIMEYEQAAGAVNS
jgi:hypothetical protein